MKVVWPDTSVEEGNLTRNISTLRNVLSEASPTTQYIETVPWRGYRFVASVKQVRGASVTKPIDSIAVLPFTNAASDPSLEFLSDGITENVINTLSQLKRLRVMSRNSSLRYRGRQVDASEVGGDLKVRAVMVGRLAKHDELLSISVELVDALDDTHIWGAQYLRHFSDICTIPAKIAEEISAKLHVQLTGDEERRMTRGHTKSAEAYQLYLKGRYYFNKLTLDGVQKGVEYLQHAIETDPTYALAYAALGDCHNYLANRDEAKRSVNKALELDVELGEAHASLGFFRFLYDWDFAGAESEFVKALALSPNYAEAHHWYGIFLANLGRHVEARQEAQLAVEREPLSLLMNMTGALNFYLARQYDLAIAQLQRVIEMEPNFPAVHGVLGCVYVQKQMFLQALAEYQKVIELTKGATVVETSVKVLMGQAHARSGKKAEAMQLLEEANAAGTASPYSIAGVYAALNNQDKAFESLNKAYEEHDMQLVSLKVDPSLDGLRDDVRFADLVRRVGLSR